MSYKYKTKNINLLLKVFILRISLPSEPNNYQFLLYQNIKNNSITYKYFYHKKSYNVDILFADDDLFLQSGVNISTAAHIICRYIR